MTIAAGSSVAQRFRAGRGVCSTVVRSTGVFCRPSCPSRRPRREQVRFFPIPEVAEQAGFRSCLRCKPVDAAVRDPHLELVQRVCRRIEREPEDEGAVSLAELSEAVGLSPYHLQRVSSASWASARASTRGVPGRREGELREGETSPTPCTTRLQLRSGL